MVRTSIILTVAALLASACGPASEQPATSGVSSTVAVAPSPGESEESASLVDIEDEHDWRPSVDPIYGVTVVSDIVYGQGEVDGGGTFDDLLLDLYVPVVEGQDRFPLVVTIHGGGFNGGSKAKTAFVSDQFAQRGYIVASINYRLSGDDPVPSARVQALWDEIRGASATAQARAAVAAMDDTMSALDFLHARPDVEPSRTVLWGNSAGAITAVFVGFAMDDFDIERPLVAAVISNSGGFVGQVGTAAMFIEEDDGVINEAPYFYSEGPIFMTHATGDPTVPYQLSQDIVNRAEAVGHPHVRFSVDADTHGLPDGLFQTEFSPGVSVFQAQVNWLDSHPVGVAETPEDSEPEAVLGASLSCPWDQSDPTLHTFIVAGQSGMVAQYGQAGTLPAEYETGIDQLQMWDNGSWKRLGLSTENGNGAPRYGPDLAFAWTMHAACPDSNIGIIKYAVGGTSIDTWVPGGENGAQLLSNVIAAYQAHPDITFEGFLYKQGAGDMHNRAQAESWGEKYLSIVDSTRGAAIVPNDLPFIHGTVRVDGFPDDISGIDPDSIPSPVPSRPFAVHVTLEQWMVQYERPGLYPTIMRDIPVGDDGTHSTPDGIRLQGRNYAETYANEAN